MPVHLGSLDAKMLLRSEVAAQRTKQDDGQEQDANGDMETMETSECEERRTEDF